MGRVNARIMMVTTGSFADVNVELQVRGHRPVIVSAPFWRQWIEEAGVEYEMFESGWDIPPENPAQCLDPTALAKSADGMISLHSICRTGSGRRRMAASPCRPMRCQPLCPWYR